MSQQINLFNPALLRQRQRLSAMTMVQGLAVILAGGGALAGYAHMQARELSAQALSTSGQLAAAKAQLASAVAQHAPREKSRELAAELQRLESEIAAQRRAFEVVRQGGVGDTKGYSEHLHAFSRQAVQGLWLTGFTIDSVGKRMELQGRALQPELVPAYIHRLSQEPTMQGKSFAQLMISRPDAEAQKRDQGGDANAPGRRVPAKYLEFVLKSSVEAPARNAGQGRDMPPAAPALPGGMSGAAGAASVLGVPGVAGGLPNLRDLAGAH